jgi:hypothetical protein
MEIHEFIKKRPYLIWYVKDYDALDNEAIVEAVLNYGEWEDVQEMIQILGIKEVATIFRRKSKEKRCNYLPKTKNYFNLYFNKYA